MKFTNRIIGTSLAVIMMCSAAISASALTEYIKGDSNGDRSVTINDVTDIQRVLAKVPVSDEKGVKRRGNVTGGTININDATAIQRYLAGYDNSYSIGTTLTYDENELPFVPK